MVYETEKIEFKTNMHNSLEQDLIFTFCVETFAKCNVETYGSLTASKMTQ